MGAQFPATPPGFELVHRFAIIRLGEDLRIHTEGNHASVGVTSIEIVDKRLIVHSDFQPDELCVKAVAIIDATLAAKQIFAGCSGGGATTTIALYSGKAWGGTYPIGSVIPPNSRAVFDSTVDNLWVELTSLRPVVEA